MPRRIDFGEVIEEPSHDIEIARVGLTAGRAAKHHDKREVMHLGQNLEAAVDRGTTEPPRCIN